MRPTKPLFLSLLVCACGAQQESADAARPRADGALAPSADAAGASDPAAAHADASFADGAAVPDPDDVASAQDAGAAFDGGDDFLDDGATPMNGTLALPECLGLGGIDEACTLYVNGTACESVACDRLVVSFSGGDGTCQDSVLAGYASHGYAAVCVQYFATSAGSGAIPYIDEASRMDLALRAATRGSWARRYWTGANLVLDGISHGATAPVIAMARTTLDDQPHWHGTAKTVGCFYDGSYDQAATAALLKTGRADGGPCLLPVPYQRWLARYCGEGATADNCDLSTNPKAQADTVSAVPGAAFAIRDFLMFECGSALAACAGDILPAAPVQALCSDIAQDPLHHCEFRRLPEDSHIACHGRAFDQCRVWADGQFQ